MLAALQFNLFPRHHQGLTGKIFALLQIRKPHSVRFGVHIDILHKLLLSTMPGDLHQQPQQGSLEGKSWSQNCGFAALREKNNFTPRRQDAKETNDFLCGFARKK